MEMTPKKSANKWLLGLGIGCGGAVGAVASSDFFVNNPITNYC